ncbi:hypothetical protein B0H15DRAFT_125336 [Mycena belliarum]|uniref:Uncharacterized protein n=1 Tax=Mycena belliarum TaxID=1033014 RepID=A0AAD6XTF7_9AGAR|nr:hypothetical protein B0H15DRAFT_125336 [Mycena belliae]
MPSLFPAGPELPEFKSLLVKGAYHPSAPIHLALSHTAKFPATQTLLITPSREAIAIALQNYNDDWLSVHSGRGRILEVASNITVFYPPTPAHFAYLISTLSVDGQSPSLNAMTTLDRPPSLIILHELSSYFMPDASGHPWTLSSYMTLIARTLSSLAYFSVTASETSAPPTDIALALFDSQLDSLKLPVVKHPTAPGRKLSKLENVAFFVQKYFELMAVFEEDDMFLSSSQEEEGNELTRQRRNRMHIFRSGRTEAIETHRWIEQPNLGSGGIVFDWGPSL